MLPAAEAGAETNNVVVPMSRCHAEHVHVLTQRVALKRTAQSIARIVDQYLHLVALLDAPIMHLLRGVGPGQIDGEVIGPDAVGSHQTLALLL